MNNSKFIVLEYDLLSCENLNNTDKILYGWIVALAQNNINGCYATAKTLSDLVGLKSRQLYYSLARLKKYNFITVEKIKINDKLIRFIKPTINEFIRIREEENKKIRNNELVEFDWLNEEE